MDSLQRRILAQAERYPDRRSVAYFTAEGEHGWLSRAELVARAGRVAAGLAEAGLGVDDVCIFQLPSDERQPALVLGALLAGATPLLMAPPTFWRGDPDLDGFLEQVLEKTGAPVVVRSELVEDESVSVGRVPRFVSPEELLSTSSALTAPRGGFGELAAMQLTSGTTGAPRICVWRQPQILAALDRTSEALGLGEEGAIFNWTPLHHDLGLVNCLLFSLVQGVPLTLMSPTTFVRNPALWLRGLSDTGATTTWSPNFGFSLTARRARDQELEGVRLDHVDGFWNAAERIHVRTMREFHERFRDLGVAYESLRTSYGCAENVGGATFSKPGRSLSIEYVVGSRLRRDRLAVRAEAESPGTEPIVGVGSPRRGVRIEILSEAGEPLPAGAVGEIAIDTDSEMESYLGESTASQSVTREGRLLTGDLGYLRDDELYWIGRVRERISIRGLKIDPSDLEPLLLDVAGLREGSFVAFGVDDSRLGTQRLIVVAETRLPLESTPQKLIAGVRHAVFERFLVQVDDVVLVPPGTLGKTSSGKRRNRQLRSVYLEGGLEGLRIQDHGGD